MLACLLLAALAAAASADTRRLPDDPRFGDLWRLDNTGQTVLGKVGVPDADIDAPEAWARTTGSPGVTIAVVDSGVAYDHPDLAPNMWANAGESGTDDQGRPKAENGVDDDQNGYADDARGWDFVDGDNDPRDLSSHGTHVAGIAAAAGDNGIGTTGVSWHSKVMPVRVLGPRYATTAAQVAQGLDYAADNGADIVNLSYGMPVDSPAVRAVLDAHPDVLFVFAAGNNPAVDLDAAGNDVFPCEDPEENVVCVASTDSNDVRSGYSKWGRKAVDLGAPGNYAFSTVPARSQAWANSFESPAAGTPEAWDAGQADGSPAAAWAVSTQHAKSGTQSVTDSPDGPYAAGSNTWIQNHDPIDLRGRQGCRLSYTLALDTAPGDVFYLQARRDGAIAPYAAGDPDEYASAGGTLDTSRQEDISALDGAADARLRFGLLAQPSATANTHDGAYLDLARVTCLTSTYSAGGATEIDSMAGTSMASPVVAGTAALVASEYPGFSPVQVKRAILDGTDKIPAMSGKTVSGGRLNAAGALAAAELILHPPPVKPAAKPPAAKPAPAAAKPAPAAPAKPATPARPCTAKASIAKKAKAKPKKKKRKKKKRRKKRKKKPAKRC